MKKRTRYSSQRGSDSSVSSHCGPIAGTRVEHREFLTGATGVVVGASLPGWGIGVEPASEEETQQVFSTGTRTWLGPQYWANRLEDWRYNEGRLECLTGSAAPGFELRTVALLTREIVAGAVSGQIRARATLLEDAGGGGFCGFLVRIGGGELDYRAAALAQRGSGEGGGFLCTYGTDGQLRFREHTSEALPLAFAELPAETLVPTTAPAATEVLLSLNITPESTGGFSVVLTASDAVKTVLGSIARRGVVESELVGGISLASSATPTKAGARYAFADVSAGGPKIAARPERAFGPILGALHSLNGRVLKLSAQLAPVGGTDPQQVQLVFRRADRRGPGQFGGTAQLQPGYVATFRLDNWDSTCNYEYVLVYALHAYQGTIRKDPADRASLKVGLVSCVRAAARNLETAAGIIEPPQTEIIGRYTHKNLYFPHVDLVRNIGHHDPDLLVFAGDQFYENTPTRRLPVTADATLDYLYKWYLWVWSFRELTRNRPAIILVDDHDVFQGNLWGNGGNPAPDGNPDLGGYVRPPDFVNMVQHTQCSHDPDPFDPTPVAQGIGVYFGSFTYGGVSFAILEDRKWKTPNPMDEPDNPSAVLLGDRQHAFLAAWGATGPAGMPRICLCQTVFGCLQTAPDGTPLRDGDSNGAPKHGRDQALRLLRDASALILSGDQHLASVVHHGIDTFGDGPVQFSGPAGGTRFQRWFEPNPPLPNPGAMPHTGDFVDGFGNKMRILAVANPKVTFAEYRKHRSTGQRLDQRSLKSEGYGIVRVNRTKRAFVLECWPWNVDPAAPGAEQFLGWPLRVAFPPEH